MTSRVVMNVPYYFLYMDDPMLAGARRLHSLGPLGAGPDLPFDLSKPESDATAGADQCQVENEAQDDEDFVRSVAHDLNNLIAAAAAGGDLLVRAGSLNHHQTQILERVRLVIGQMSELTESLLEATESSRPTLRREPVDLAALLDGVVQSYQAQASARQQTLALRPARGKIQITGDVRLLRRAFCNLVLNAIKYTPAGGRITVSLEAGKTAVLVHVQDTGIGIPESELPLIFNRSHRVQTNETKRIEGSGLGLSIVRRIVEQHGGQVTVSSVVGKGSCFTVRLPE